MEKKQWILFLLLVLGFSNLLLLLVSFSTILTIKNEINSLKLKPFSCPEPHPQTPPNTVSKKYSDSNYFSNHEHFQFRAKMANSISLVDHVRKDSGFRDTQLNKYLSGQRKRLRIGVPLKSSFKQFEGFSIDVFRAAVNLIPKKFHYQMVPFNGSSDELLQKVALKRFDAAVGDIMIKSEDYQLLEFSRPYAEARLSMVVKARADKSQPWLLFTLFTPWMWFTMAAMTVFTGFVIWFIEYQNNEHLNNSDSPAKSISSVLWISLATLYWGHRESPNHCLSHFVLGPWLLLVLVVSATFTSSLSSILTDSNSSQSLALDVNELIRTNSMIGTDGSLYVDRYLVNVLGFPPRNIRTMSSPNEYAKALSTGDVKAAFLLTPFAKVFLAKYRKGFVVTGPTYNIGGFGFVFQKGSPLASDMSQAILRLSENGDLRKTEDQVLPSFISSTSSNAKMTHSLGPAPFSGFFIISGGASVIALLITLIRWFKTSSDNFIQPGFVGGRVWPILHIVFTLFQRRIVLQPIQNTSTEPSRLLSGTALLNKLIISLLQSDLYRSTDIRES